VSEVVLEARGLRLRFGGVVALDGVDLFLAAGSRTGILGPNGAGKTTLFDALSGLVRLDGGRLFVGGRDLTTAPPHDRAAAGLARSFQDARLFPSMTVDEALRVAATPRSAPLGPVASLVGWPATVRADRAARRRAGELLEEFGLTGYADVLVSELSTGTRRVVDLAAVTARSPAVVLLDEPSAGLAQAEVEQLAPLLRRVADDTGAAVVVVEHDIPLVADFADTLVAMESGRVIARGRPDAVLADPLVVEAYLGADVRTIRRSGRRH
jgi:ABC-type branched-subunit amino acid transport system ATPase component